MLTHNSILHNGKGMFLMNVIWKGFSDGTHLK